MVDNEQGKYCYLEIILFTFRIGTAKAEDSIEVDGLSIGQYAKAALKSAKNGKEILWKRDGMKMT